MNAPLISVIVPTFNRAAYLGAAVQSALGQVGIDALEVVVVDDCSTDDTASIVAQFSGDKVRFGRHEVNRGGGAARNTGIEEARGRYVAFLDSDDQWHPEKLMKQLAALDRSTCPEETLCYTQVRALSSHGTEILPRRAKRAEESVGTYLFTNAGHIQTSTILLSRELAMRTRFDPQLRRHQDYDFCLRADRLGADFVLVDQPLVTWRHDNRGDRISKSVGVEVSEAFLDSRREQLGDAAAAAFWVRQIFPRKIRSSPVASLRELTRGVVKGVLPMRWYFDWVGGVVRRRLHLIRSEGGV